MDQPEIAMMIRDMIKDNIEISIYRHNDRIIVELYYNGELIDMDGMKETI